MSEWKTYKLGEICKNVVDYRGKTPAKLGADWATSGYRVFSAKNIKTGHIVQTDSIRYVDEDLYRKWMKDEVERGDIIITSEAPLGEVYYWDRDEKIVLGQRLFGLKINKVCYSKYLYYYMTTVQFQSELRNRATGTTVVGLRQPELLKCTVSLPPLDEQRKIAGILGALDDKIELNRRINANLEEQAQALFKSWFVDFEPFKDGPFVDSELGKIPKGWRVVELQTLVTIKRGGSPRPIQNFLSDSGYNWLKISDATSEQSPYIYDIKEHIKESGFNKTVYIKSGELVLSNSATPGIPKILGVDSCIHDGWLYFPKSSLSNEFLYLLFKENRKKFLSQGNGSVFLNLKTDILKSFKIIVPNNLDELKKFNIILHNLFQEIKYKTEEIRILSTLRDTLLPKLMKGEIKVN